MPSSVERKVIRCREIIQADGPKVIDLLSRGFPQRSKAYWAGVWNRLDKRSIPEGYPKYGCVLECDGQLVGILLLIYSSVINRGESQIRCNVSSWFIEPAFRPYASILSQRASRHRNVTYFNVSAAPHTWPILEAQGYHRFVDGRMISVPALMRSAAVTKVQLITPQMPIRLRPNLDDIDLLLEHASYGCLSVICETATDRYPFVFGLRRRFGLPIAHLLYCRDLQDFVRLAAPLGRFLLRRGYPLVILDCEHRVHRVLGLYLGGRPRFFKGDRPLHAGDLAYSELALFQS